MVALTGFDATQYDPRVSYVPLPEGWYKSIIRESNLRDNKNGSGKHLELVFELIEGEFAGRMLWKRLNIQHHNQTAVQIALHELSAICYAVNVLKPSDSNQLHNIPMLIRVVLRKRDDGSETNEIVEYKAVQAPVVQTTPTQQPFWRR